MCRWSINKFLFLVDYWSLVGRGHRSPGTNHLLCSEVMAQSQHSILRYYHHPVLNISTFNCSQCTNNNLFLRPPPSHLNIQFWASQSNYRGGGINWRTAHFPKSRKFPKITRQYIREYSECCTPSWNYGILWSNCFINMVCIFVASRQSDCLWVEFNLEYDFPKCSIHEMFSKASFLSPYTRSK